MSGYNNNHRLNFIRHCCFGVAVLLLFIAGTGCSKNEAPVKESFQTDFNFLAVSQDDFQLGIKIDDEVRTTDLKAPADDPKTITLNYFNKEKKISIYDVVTNQVIFDSTYTVNTSIVSVGLYQKTSGAPLLYVAPPPTEAAPPVGYCKMSFVYTFPPLPDEVKIVVMNHKGTGVDYEPTDSFMLKKGEFSRYFLGRIVDRKPELYFYTPGPERKLLAQVDRNKFADLTSQYAIYSIRKYADFPNNVYGLIAQKLY